MKKKIFLFTILTCAALLLSACQKSTGADDTKKDAPEKTAGSSTLENFKLQRLDGTETDLNSLLQKAELTVVNIWDPACDTCPDEMKIFSELSGQYSGKGIQVVGIVRGVTKEKDEDALAVIADTDAHYIHLLDSDELDKQILDQYPDTPTTIFISRDGRQLGTAYTKAEDKAFWETEFEKYHSQVCENDHPADCAVG